MKNVMGYSSPVGELTLVSDGKSLTEISFLSLSEYEEKNGECQKSMDQALSDTKKWLDIYFEGKNPVFFPEMNLKGTEFQNMVWEILMTIPYGISVSYGAIAKRIAEKRGIARMSSQAVGGAVGRNPIPIIVPCHRVLGKNQEITGYAGGLDWKEYLLKLEKIAYAR